MSNASVSTIAMVAGTILLLSACSNSQKADFVTKCHAKQKSNEYCECTYDLAKESMDESAFKLFVPMFLGDTAEQAKVQASMGIMKMGLALAKFSWLEANLKEACPIK